MVGGRVIGGCVDVVRCHSFARGGEQSSKASVGVVFASKWPTGHPLAAPGSRAASPKPHSADGGAADTALADQSDVMIVAPCGPDGEEEGVVAIVSSMLKGPLGHVHTSKHFAYTYSMCSSSHGFLKYVSHT